MQNIWGKDLVSTILYLAVFVVLINLAVLLFRNYIKKLFIKGKVSFKENIVHDVMQPIYYLSVFLVVYFLIKQFEYTVKTEKFIDNIMATFVVFFLSMFVSKFVEVIINYWLKVKKKTKQPPRLIAGTVIALIYVVAGLLVLSLWGVQITPLLAALGVGGIALGLGLQETLTNLFAGLHLVSDEPITTGDYIVLKDGTEGFVYDIGWRSTRLKTVQNNVVIIPNGILAQSVIENKSADSSEVSVTIDCGVSYNSDLSKVEKVILDEISKYKKKNEYLNNDFEHVVRFKEFGESNIDFSIILRLNKYDDRFIVKHEIIMAIKDRFDSEKIEISWPVRKIVKG